MITSGFVLPGEQRLEHLERLADPLASEVAELRDEPCAGRPHGRRIDRQNVTATARTSSTGTAATASATVDQNTSLSRAGSASASAVARSSSATRTGSAGIVMRATLVESRGRGAARDLGPSRCVIRSRTPDVPAVPRESKRLGVAAAFVEGVLVHGDVAVVGDRVAAVGLSGRGAGTAIPGLVDAQVNGYAGVDLLAAEPEALVELGEALLRDGVFAYLPTLITSDVDHMLAALRRIAALGERRARGAAIIGVHLEGPFLSPERAGAHPADYLRSPSVPLLDLLLAAGPVRMVTLAPELSGALELIEICVSRGIVVSLGHSNASSDEAARAFAAGASAVTHLFNAMAPIGGRAPGLAGTALATDGVGIQLIADGAHVSDELIRLAFAAAPGRCSLVSDAIAAAGLGDGDYRVGSVAIEVRGGIARRADRTLAGSAARLRDGLARLAELGIDRGHAITAVTARPASLIGASDFGVLERGGRADVLVVDDELRLQRVIASGIEIERD